MTAITTAPAPATSAPRSGTSAWLVVGAVLGALMIAQSAVSFGALLAKHTDTVALAMPAAATLVVHVGSGTVTVTGDAAADEITGTAARTWSFVQPQLVTSRDGDTAELRVGCRWYASGWCDAAIELTVPQGTRVELRGSSGDVAVRGIHAPVTATTNSGRVTVTDVVGDVTAEGDSGDVSVTRVTGDVDAQVDSGRIDVADSTAAHVTARSSSGDIRVDLAVDPQSVQAHASSGQVTVLLPDDPAVAYRLDLSAGSGSTSGEVRTDPSSARSITASAGSGDVSVAYRG